MTRPEPSAGLRTPEAGAVSRGLQELAGAVMILLGSLGLLGLVFISNDPSPGSERLLFSLGLPGMGLASALAQFLVLAGAAVLWAAARRRR